MCGWYGPSGVFTFHYVSINTLTAPYNFPVCKSLHSTMFLLIPLVEELKEVSRRSLHSTMFLLIPVPAQHQFRKGTFTFHYVSINTRSSEPPINSSILYHILSTMIFFYLFIYFDITRFTGSTILLMFFTFVDLS